MKSAKWLGIYKDLVFEENKQLLFHHPKFDN